MALFERLFANVVVTQLLDENYAGAWVTPAAGGTRKWFAGAKGYMLSQMVIMDRSLNRFVPAKAAAQVTVTAVARRCELLAMEKLGLP